MGGAQKHNERCDVLSAHLINCESWMRTMKDDVLRREIINVRAELLEEKYTRKMDLQKLEEAEENINLMLMFFEKFGGKLAASGRELRNIDAAMIASAEQGAKDRRTVDLLKQKTLLQEQLVEKNDELKRTKDIIKLEAKASSSKKDEEFHLLVSKQSSTINDLRSQILKLSEENNTLLSEQLVQTTEKENNRSRKKEKQAENEKDETKTNTPSRSSSQPPKSDQQQPSSDKTGGAENFNQMNSRFFRGNRGNQGQRFNRGGRGYNNNDRGGGNFQQNAYVNPNDARRQYNQTRGRRFRDMSNPEKDALLSLVHEQQAVMLNKFQEENSNYHPRGHYDRNQRGIRGHPQPLLRGGPRGESASIPEKEKELSPEALLSLIKEQQATINQFHSQNLKLHEDNTKLVAQQLAQDIVKKEKKKRNKKIEQDANAEEKPELRKEKQEGCGKNATQDRENRIFACDVCGQISSDIYSLQIHTAFCGEEQ